MVLLYGAKLLKQTWTNYSVCNLAKTCSAFNTLCSVRSHSIPLFTIISFRWTFNTASQLALLCMIFRTIFFPANICNLFLYPTQAHSYNTRFSEIGSFNIKYSRTNHLKHSFSIFGARVWNSIPQSIRTVPKHEFKVSLHQLLLRILELEDTCVDTSTETEIQDCLRSQLLKLWCFLHRQN